MITNPATSVVLKHDAFCDYKGASIADVWRHGLNPEYWRHGITINQGLGWSVSEVKAIKRLNYIRVHLLKAMFGNNFRRKSAKIIFLTFKQGSHRGYNQHYHALMAVEGDHNWSDREIAEAIGEIECNRAKRHWEKGVHVDWDWIKDNRFHSYVARDAAYDADSVLVM
jgi:hypothetical protein